MKPNVTALLLSALALAATPAAGPAQQNPSTGQQAGEGRAQPAQMYEDIEILRRLLADKLRGLYAPSSQVVSQQPLWGFSGGSAANYLGQTPYYEALTQTNYQQRQISSTAVSPSTLEGVYLKGQGVVYTVTLPPSARSSRTETSGSSARPLSDWERMRKEVRHEQPPAEQKDRSPRKLSPEEAVLHVLAENGRHLSQLGANESITVVITFRQPGVAGWFRGQDGRLYLRTTGGTGNWAGPNPNPTAAANQLPGGQSPSTSRDYELLGDLHLKQGKVREALSAYQKAVELKPEPWKKAILSGKLAVAYQALGQADQARRALEQMESLKQAVAQAPATTTKGKETSAPTLPSKLIISVPKKLLDQAGKMSFDDFRKAATWWNT
jgi:tetratricopeptide (TPR) repeat protein